MAPSMEDVDKADEALSGEVLTGSDSAVTDLVPQRSSVVVRRDALVKAKRGVQAVKQKTDKAMKRLESAIKVQRQALAARVEHMEKLVGRLSEALWSLDIYIGSDEKVFQLAAGEPADPSVPVRIRQLVLYMDEESLICSDEGGMDFEQLDDFDEWISDPDHPERLQQVLPDEKGVVALKPRRKMKDYGNFMLNVQLDKENKKTYVLVRNGGNLFRVCSSLVVGKYLFPTQDEYRELFFERSYDWELKKEVVKPLKPGSYQYDRSVDKAQAQQRAYLRVMLLLQGLLDRTSIFEPIPVGRMNLCDPSTYEGLVEFVYEVENVLGDGKPSFADWQYTHNNKLDVGKRVVCSFGFGSDREYAFTVCPKYSALPETGRLYTVVERKDHSIKFLYERGDMVYSSDGRRACRRARRRASCRVDITSGRVIAFDDVTVEDVEYYMSSRLHRHEYIEMIPILKAVLRAKRVEAEEEAPLRKLLIGEIAKGNDVSIAEAEAEVDGLIHWWKFSNKVHRALTSDDSKAIRMIVKEFGLRRRAEGGEKVDRSTFKIVKRLRLECKNSLWIGRKRSGDYVVIAGAKKSEPFVKVAEVKYLKRTDSLEIVKSRKWICPADLRMDKYVELWTSKRWVDWDKETKSTHRINPELTVEVMKVLRERQTKREENSKRRYVGMCRVMYANKKDEFHIIVTKDLAGKWCDHPVLGGVCVPCLSLLKAEVTFSGDHVRQCWLNIDRDWRCDDDDLQNLQVGNIFEYGTDQKWEILDIDQKVLALFLLHRSEALAAKRKGDKDCELAFQFVRQLLDHCEQKAEEAAYKAFLDDGNLSELWEQNKDRGVNKDRRNSAIPNESYMRYCLEVMIDAGIDPAGKSCEQVVGLAQEQSTFEQYIEGGWGRRSGPDERVPANFVFSAPEPEDEDGDE